MAMNDGCVDGDSAMTTTRLAAENRRRLICKLLAEHPYLTHAAIARIAGCGRKNVDRIAGLMRREKDAHL